MLERFRSGPGFRAAMALALFAALCFVAPPAAMAFGHGGETAHCLAKAEMANHGHSAADSHAGHRQQGDQGQPPAGKAPGCCGGLFCLSALLPSAAPAFVSLMLPAPRSPRPETRLAGPSPEQPDRPPIASLAV